MLVLWLLDTFACSYANACALVLPPAPLLKPVQLGLLFVYLLTLVLVAPLPMPVFAFMLCELLLMAMDVCWLACTFALLLLLLIVFASTYLCHSASICYSRGGPSSYCCPIPAPFTPPAAIKDVV